MHPNRQPLVVTIGLVFTATLLYQRTALFLTAFLGYFNRTILTFKNILFTPIFADIKLRLLLIGHNRIQSSIKCMFTVGHSNQMGRYSINDTFHFNPENRNSKIMFQIQMYVSPTPQIKNKSQLPLNLRKLFTLN